MPRVLLADRRGRRHEVSWLALAMVVATWAMLWVVLWMGSVISSLCGYSLLSQVVRNNNGQRLPAR